MGANEDLLNAALRNQIAVRRFTTREVREILTLLEDSEREIIALLRKRLHGRARDFKSKQYKALLREIRKIRAEAMRVLEQRLRRDLKRLAAIEAEAERRALAFAAPFDMEFASVELALLHQLVTTNPFAGGSNAARTLAQWFAGLAAADQRRLVGAIQMGLLNHETIDDIVRRVAGTRAAGYRDGILAITRRNAEAVVRTAVNHVSNGAREALWAANSDFIAGLRWVSTLDGRTTAICRARDGAVAMFRGLPVPPHLRPLEPPTARPPAHVNCRSILVALLDPLGIADFQGVRPFVRDERTRRFREMDFRAQARANLGDSTWSKMSPAQRNAAIRQERRQWTSKAVGQVPASTTYNDWLKAQPISFQQSVLGKTKAKLFRDGNLHLDQFIDPKGKELTLSQLADLRPEAFLSAGLTP